MWAAQRKAEPNDNIAEINSMHNAVTSGHFLKSCPSKFITSTLLKTRFSAAKSPKLRLSSTCCSRKFGRKAGFNFGSDRSRLLEFDFDFTLRGRIDTEAVQLTSQLSI